MDAANRLDRDLSIKEVAELTQQSTRVVSDLVRMGRFPNAYKAGRGGVSSPVRIPAADVDRYRRTQPRAAGSA
ncbi:helix-turn-helix domain-containing protein [Arthrobacter sp. Y-9]|uniref:helix-turn-helix domain-containing protein n=1 Tax=Arthrobacter sp. Y-9 TaxID=3039385 RepID=UPI00241FEBB5|nr:helix-turn-helix domain-containing protein [Arthrobacter sp. Y-9]WFR84662.1 helix-turn-helix domain-containing protein [Arthrobacter sp. Y-9]